MPNPRNRLKFTGDTHLPDVGDDRFGDEEDTLRFEPVQEFRRGQGATRSPDPAPQARANTYLDAARDQVRQRPVAVLAGAFVLGWVFARM